MTVSALLRSRQTARAIVPYYPPNDGFDGRTNYAVLQPGAQIWRYGGEGGRFVTDPRTLYWQLSLPPNNAWYGGARLPVNYTVLRPIGVQGGPAAPAFGQIGGGMQYTLPKSIKELVANGFLH